MGVLTSILASILAGAVVAELYVWGPAISAFITRYAVKRLPSDAQERFAEEWLAHQSELPNGLARLVSSVGFYIAATRICFASGHYRVQREHILLVRFFVVVAFYTLKFQISRPRLLAQDFAADFQSVVAALLHWDRSLFLDVLDVERRPSWKAYRVYMDERAGPQKKEAKRAEQRLRARRASDHKP